MKKSKSWCAGYVSAGAKHGAPYEWYNVWMSLLRLGMDRKLLCKAEAASMVIRTYRTERWLIDKHDHEYAYKKDSLEATKKLIYQAVISQGSPYSDIALKRKILQKVSCSIRCLLPIGHSGNHSNSFIGDLRCSICGEIISYNQIMGKARATRGFRIDPDVCTMGHINPLTSGGMHNAQNVSWQHKQCNNCQGNLSRKDFLKLISKIIKFSKKKSRI